MAATIDVTVLEQCRLYPPSSSAIPPITLPLTFLDIPWLFYPPNQTLLFFPKPPPKTTVTTLLKQSLSLTLHHFHPLAGNLASPPPPAEPYILYTKGDSVSLTVAESNTNIIHLSGHHPRRITNLYSLLPQLPIISMSRDTHVVPLLAIQITIFTGSGYSIGVTAQPAAADERTLDQFMKCWASVCISLLKKESNFIPFNSITPPWFNRSVIPDKDSLKTRFLNQWWLHRSKFSKDSHVKPDRNNNVRSTFLLTSSDMNIIKQHILKKCKMINEDPPVHLSPYVSACSYIWICLFKVHEETAKDVPMYLGFNAGGITRLGYQVPASYLGSCIAFGRCVVIKRALLGDDAIVFAAKSLGKEIKRLDMDVLEGADRWICDWDELDIRVLGSPKVDSYGLDFGWGKVEKVEKISSDDDDGRVNVVSLCSSRDFDGGMEIGIVLSSEKMTAFTSVFNGGLMEFVCDQDDEDEDDVDNTGKREVDV